MNHIEQSQRNLFSSVTIDRSIRTLGNDDSLKTLIDNQHARFLPIWNNKILVFKNRGRLAKVEITRDELSTRFTSFTTPIYLGYIDKSHYFAAEVEPSKGKYDEFTDFRNSATFLAIDDASLLGYALTMLTWHKNYRYCGLCGAQTLDWQGGHILKCSNPACLHEHYPRTDPAIIVLVQYQDRALFGRKAEWPAFRYSTIAGFIEPGESAEQAVIREVTEETGIQVIKASYHSSQPWPFSSSLMLGYMAQANGLTDIQLNDKELEDAQWLSRAQISKQLITGKFVPPTSISISYRLIEDWFDSDSSTPFRLLCENNKSVT